MLYLVATPIGNLRDITFRAIETLKSCDYILCEDTRHSSVLLHHYEIQKPLVSFHKFSEHDKEDKTILDLKSGKTICLISDAGTPGISDPGALLVKRCVAEEIPVQSIPGPCAAITALTCSGLDTDRFQFFGFLPKKAGELKSALQEILFYAGTTICYESPKRILDVLECIHSLAPERELFIARELTKKFEEHQHGNAETLLQRWQDKEIRGEIVLLISGKKESATSAWEDLSPEEHVAMLQETYKLSKNEAIKMAAGQRGIPKREIYNKICK